MVLVASGTPDYVTPLTFTINTSPSCNFSRDVVIPVAVISYWRCNYSTDSRSNPTHGVPIYPGQYEKRMIPYVISSGSYSISSTVNGITFASSGILVGYGDGVANLGVPASGTPIAGGNYTFYIQSNQSDQCSFVVAVN